MPPFVMPVTGLVFDPLLSHPMLSRFPVACPAPDPARVAKVGWQEAGGTVLSLDHEFPEVPSIEPETRFSVVANDVFADLDNAPPAALELMSQWSGRVIRLLVDCDVQGRPARLEFPRLALVMAEPRFLGWQVLADEAGEFYRATARG